MNKILTAALLAAALLGAARADPIPLDRNGRPVSPEWTKVETGNGAAFYAAYNTISRINGNGPLSGNASILLYSGGTGEFYTVLFNCRGKFMIWSHPEDIRDVRSGSMIDDLQRTTCGL